MGTKSQTDTTVTPKVTYTVLGVTGGNSGNEIDYNQTLTIKFDAAQHIDTLTIGLLFNGPEYSDLYETAALSANGGQPYYLTASGIVSKNPAVDDATAATWTGSGSVTCVSQATSSAAGVWLITNPFGDAAITSLVLTPTKNSNPCANGSDFGLVGFKTSSVPADGSSMVPDAGSTMALLGCAFVALGAFGRKFRH